MCFDKLRFEGHTLRNESNDHTASSVIIKKD